MKITVFYDGTSLLAPLERAEDDINARHKLGLRVVTYNCGAPLNESDWRKAEEDIASSELVISERRVASSHAVSGKRNIGAATRANSPISTECRRRSNVLSSEPKRGPTELK